jgi:hypothetical protein
VEKINFRTFNPHKFDRNYNMDNPEEVMQMLERFSKQKQKDLSEYSENNES